jgi:hypothetical protein
MEGCKAARLCIDVYYLGNVHYHVSVQHLNLCHRNVIVAVCMPSLSFEHKLFATLMKTLLRCFVMKASCDVNFQVQPILACWEPDNRHVVARLVPKRA